MLIRRWIVLVGLAAGASAGGTASFDCARAVTRTESAVCASGDLSQLDRELDATYRAALARAADPQSVRIAQRAWLKHTRDVCDDEACLADVYRQRIAALQTLPSQRPAPTSGHTTELTPELAFYERASRVALTPLFPDLAHLRFGDGPTRLPKDFKQVPRSVRDRQLDLQQERENGWPACDLYRSDQARVVSTEIAARSTALCFDDGRLLNLVALFPGQENYHRLVARVAGLLHHEGERDRYADEARTWRRTINGLPMEVQVSRVGIGAVYSERLEHVHDGRVDVAVQSPAPVGAPRRQGGRTEIRVLPTRELAMSLAAMSPRCPETVVRQTIEAAVKIDELTRHRQTDAANNLASQQLMILRSVGCITR